MAEQAGLESEVLSASAGLSNCKAPNLIPEERQVAGGLAPCVEEWTQRHEGSCLVVQGGCSDSSCQDKKNKKAAAPLLRLPARNQTHPVPLRFVEWNLVLWPHIAAREAGKSTSLGKSDLYFRRSHAEPKKSGSAVRK